MDDPTTSQQPFPSLDEYEDEAMTSDHTSLLINEPSQVSGEMSTTNSNYSSQQLPASMILGNIQSFMKCKHPVALFFHIFFKVAALLCYLLLTFFTSNFVIVFVTCILLLAFDFWTVKNISGRLLVGLRWWNEVQPDGSSIWRFENKKDMSDIDPLESYVFWITLYAHPLVWILLSIICFIGMRLQWFMIIGFALVLGVSNAIGYFKCQRDATSKLSEWIVRQSFVQSLLFRVLGVSR